jgi:hypothetical protein
LALDLYSKLLVLVDFVALLFLVRYLENTLMWIPFALILLMIWIWVYRLLSPLSFAWPALLSLASAAALYLDDPYVRALGLAIIIPAIGAALGTLVRPDPEKGSKTGG